MTSVRSSLQCTCVGVGELPHEKELINGFVLQTVPQNVLFEIDDIEIDWAFNTSFDFIHAVLGYINP